MKPNPNPRLTPILAAIRRRWGPDALRPLRALGAPDAAIPTGFPALDRALGGGFPRGAVTELLGAPTSGMRTLALKVIAGAQAAGDAAVYLDLEGAFDPGYAARCGVDLGLLLLVRPPDAFQGPAIARDVIAAGGAGVVVFDSTAALRPHPGGEGALASALRRLAAPLARAPCALVFLTTPDETNSAVHPAGAVLPVHAALRLRLERQRWVWQGRDVRGYAARVTVLKSRFAPEGLAVTLAFEDAVHEDGV